jgi:hypothetical protein
MKKTILSLHHRNAGGSYAEGTRGNDEASPRPIARGLRFVTSSPHWSMSGKTGAPGQSGRDAAQNARSDR